MIDRYSRPKMKALWDLKHKYEIWLEVELQACAALERAGHVPRGTSAKLRKRAKIDVDASTSTYTLHFNDEQTVAVNGVEELHFSDQIVTLPKLS